MTKELYGAAKEAHERKLAGEVHPVTVAAQKLHRERRPERVRQRVTHVATVLGVLIVVLLVAVAFAAVLGAWGKDGAAESGQQQGGPGLGGRQYDTVNHPSLYEQCIADETGAQARAVGGCGNYQH